ncbi:28S ribosomal protein s29, mitochondrial [Plakobranchus ocellatus]|uniref:Small ribosomal subunit protein mS29 n=1 Tax=Plakobranchus ocellatus TaxID=259542 RepID=A0AAV4CV81_9GAST|nr:28S ribosomal protein s29, mitochondrial [Plakobranchus ocellatus]
MAASIPKKLGTLASRAGLALRKSVFPLENGSQACACLSVAAKRSENNQRSSFRTNEADPRKHTLDHTGLYYEIPEDEMTILKTGIPSGHLRLMKSFNESCLMVRRPALELSGYLKNINLNHPAPRFVLYGRRGSGKTITMHHTMQCCHRNGWIIVHVPWAGKWVRGWFKEVAASTFKPGRYDLPADSAEWLTQFRAQNQGKLQDLKTTSEYIWTKREKAEIGTSFEEIINFGLTRLKFSSDCVGVILKELRAQAQAKGLKVLVAIDSVNAFYVQWNKLNALKNMEKKQLQPGEISLIHNFKKMINTNWTHGAVVCAVSEEANDETKRESYTPIYLLGQEGFEALDPFVPIFVPEYSEKEALSNINYFIDRNWIQNHYGKTDDGKRELMFVSNKNPFNLARICSHL